MEADGLVSCLSAIHLYYPRYQSRHPVQPQGLVATLSSAGQSDFLIRSPGQILQLQQVPSSNIPTFYSKGTCGDSCD
jgi:hypothetical protein